MIYNDRSGKGRQLLGGTILLLLAIVLVYNALFSFSYSIGPNYRNISVDTRVNITQSKPEVILVQMEDPVVLAAGTTRVLSCNATVRDWNGYADINNVTAVLYDNNTAGPSSIEDNNDHYTNSSCNYTGDDGNYTRYYTCNFTIWYYANNGSEWICNVTATDAYNFNESVNRSNSLFNKTTFSQLLAINVTSLIDYGDMAVGDTSDPVEANITNFGNYDIKCQCQGIWSL
jgi:hypothetical protein